MNPGRALASLVASSLVTTALSESYLNAMLAPGPADQSLLPYSDTARRGTGAYDAALASLWLLARDRREEAGRVLASLVAVQQPDGAIAFSFPVPAPPAGQVYVRSGAMAWAGYAASRYLDLGPAGPARPGITAMAHHVAHYLLLHRVDKPGDPRDGLILGGSGRYQVEVDEQDRVQERFIPGEVTWASTEHNIDTWFFLRSFGHVTGNAAYAKAADELGEAIVARLWRPDVGQFAQGVSEAGLDTSEALDCASWGALFLMARGDRPRAELAYQSAEHRYHDEDFATGAAGHRPYADRPVIENRALANHFRAEVPVNDWNHFTAVWPEGSAGVALAAWRLGYTDRARQIVSNLDKLRTPDGGLPGLTHAVPLEFNTSPAFAGTAWVELVRHELDDPTSGAAVWQ